MEIPYGVITECFKDRSIIPFLGAAGSFVGALGEDVLPNGARLSKELARQCGYPGEDKESLSKVAQYLEDIAADRPFLLKQIQARFNEGVSPTYTCSVIEFFSQLPRELIPRLFITTNYDLLIEKVLESRDIPFLAISHIMHGSRYAGRFAVYSGVSSDLNITIRSELEQQIHELLEDDPDTVIIYKIHGTSRIHSAGETYDSIILTESDYVEFLAADLIKKIPTVVVKYLRENRLLFLGYSLEDWNFRVLLQRMYKVQKHKSEENKRHWAFQIGKDPVEKQFWSKRGVNVYDISLELALNELVNNLGL